MFLVFMLFFFKQKTAYEMRISDWSSDVCSSDLRAGEVLLLRQDQCRQIACQRMLRHALKHRLYVCLRLVVLVQVYQRCGAPEPRRQEIGRASCRERVCQYV